jgi:hypothetical protein
MGFWVLQPYLQGCQLPYVIRKGCQLIVMEIQNLQKDTSQHTEVPNKLHRSNPRLNILRSQPDTRPEVGRGTQMPPWFSTLMVARLRRLQDLGSREVRWFVWTINTCEAKISEMSACRRAAGRKGTGGTMVLPCPGCLCSRVWGILSESRTCAHKPDDVRI